MNSETIRQSAGRGAFLQVASGGIQTIVRIGASMVLARLLLPSDFGLFGMALLLSELVLRIGALGMGIGIIAKRNVTEDDLSTAFWTMALIRIVLFLFTISCAPYLASFFSEVKLVPVIRAVSLTFLFQIMGIIGNALLKKQLKFVRIFIINVASIVFESGLAVFLVFMYSRNYWSLVVAMISASFLNNLLVFVFVRWVPKFIFDKESFKFLFRYGINSLGSSLTEYLNSNADYFIIGKLLGPKILGFYEFAYRIPFLIETRISFPLRNVMFPALAMVNDSDARLASGSIKGVKYIALICFPCLSGLAVVSELMVKVLWGEQWLPIVVPLQILCCASAIKCVGNPILDVFKCKDRPDIPFKYNLISLIFTIVSLTIFGYFFGMIGIAWAMMLSSFPILIMFVWAFRMMRASIGGLLCEIYPIILSTIITMITAYLVQYFFKLSGFGDTSVLICSVVSGVIAYWASFKFGLKNNYQEIVETLMTILKRR